MNFQFHRDDLTLTEEEENIQLVADMIEGKEEKAIDINEVNEKEDNIEKEENLLQENYTVKCSNDNESEDSKLAQLLQQLEYEDYEKAAHYHDLRDYQQGKSTMNKIQVKTIPGMAPDIRSLSNKGKPSSSEWNSAKKLEKKLISERSNELSKSQYNNNKLLRGVYNSSKLTETFDGSGDLVGTGTMLETSVYTSLLEKVKQSKRRKEKK